jgi:hypothetical protein
MVQHRKAIFRIILVFYHAFITIYPTDIPFFN